MFATKAMSSKRSRWDEHDADDNNDTGRGRKKKEKEKRKANIQKNLQESTPKALSAEPIEQQTAGADVPELQSGTFVPSKKRRISHPDRVFPLEPPEITNCRDVEIYEKLNHIEEGSYGIVYRARDTETGDIVALKKLKLDREKSGFPITSLREISTLMSARHPNIVNIREVVMGDTLSQSFLSQWS